MAYIGTPPSNAFTSLLKQDFSTSATTGYTLDHAVNNANDIALFINFVRQEPTAGYAASGTTLTLTSATASSDDMYCVYLGQALQTVNPPNASVGAAQLASNAVTTAKILDANVTSAKLASGVLLTNTPSFFAQTSANANLTRGTATLAPFDTEIFDTNSAYNNTSGNYKFTVPSGEAGRYFVFSTTQHLSSSANDLEYVEKWIYLNGSAQEPRVGHDLASSSKYYSTGITINKIMDLSVGDYIQIYIGDYTGSSTPVLKVGSNFGAYKIIE